MLCAEIPSMNSCVRCASKRLLSVAMRKWLWRKDASVLFRRRSIGYLLLSQAFKCRSTR